MLIRCVCEVNPQEVMSVATGLCVCVWVYVCSPRGLCVCVGGCYENARVMLISIMCEVIHRK